MPRFMAGVSIGAPSDVVFGQLEAPATPLLPPGGPRLVRLSPQRGLGAGYRWEFRRWGLGFRVDSVVTEYEPGLRIAFRGTAGWEMDCEAVLTPQNGRTRLELHMRYRFPAPLRWLVPGTLIRLGVWHGLQTMKRQAELVISG